MQKIASFQVDHTKFWIGMYISRIDGDIITYDIRMVKPNWWKYLTPSSLHTIEHLFATYVRNSKYSENIIYVWPMWCRTGFYFLTRDNISKEESINLIKETLQFITDYEWEIPWSTLEECGNYLDHDLSTAKKEVLPLLKKLENYTPEMLNYERHFDKKE